MINNQSNMGREQVFKELPIPDKVEEKRIFKLIYKAIFICVKLLLDIRLNLVWISEGKVIKPRGKRDKHTNFKRQERKPENPIKGLDAIKIDSKKMETIDKGAKLILKEGSVVKGGVNDEPKTPRPEEPKEQKPSISSNPDYITLGESEKEKKELEKGNDEKTS